MKKLTVAIDGPAGAGKSTVAQIVAQRLGYTYIDTGAMYRAVTWQAIKLGVGVDDEELLAKVARDMQIKLFSTDSGLKVFVDGTDVTEAIRQRDVTNLVSPVAKVPAVRQILLKTQQDMGASGAVVMDGRDIGTHVLPQAQVKIFLTASIAQRAKRRYLELKAKSGTQHLELVEIEKEIAARDEQDSQRIAAPLIKADDAVVVDTTDLSIEETVRKILDLCGEK